MLTRAGGALPFNRFCSAIKPPKVVFVFAHEASSMVALGAAALAHSASRVASASSPFTPGSVQLLVPLGGAGLNLRERTARCTTRGQIPHGTYPNPQVAVNVRVLDHYHRLALS